MKVDKPLLLNIFIASGAFLLFVPFIGGVHLFDWDEINFAESAREMIVSGDYLNVQINFLPFWEKPPLFIWMQVLSMKIFGVNEFAARIPNAVCGIVTLLVLFNIGRRLINKKFGLIWTLTYACSILPFLYFKSGIIDPWFNLFIFLGVHQFIIYRKNNKTLPVFLSSCFIGLAILTKGPVALLVFMLTAGIFWIFSRFKKIITIKHLLIFTITLMITGGFWFILQMANGNFTIIKDFIVYQVRLFQTEDAGHGGFFLYHFIVLLIGVFPASLFAIQGFTIAKQNNAEMKDYSRWMMILFWVVLVLFTIVRTKIVHYSSLCYFPLTYFAALLLYGISEKKAVLSRWVIYGIVSVGVFIILVVAILPVLGIFNHKILPLFPKIDEYTKGILMAEVNWSGFEPLVALVLVTGLILFFILQKKQPVLRGAVVLFISTGMAVYLTLLTYVGKIEQYSQGAAIEFFKSLKDKDVYVATVGYKSYAQLFYANKVPQGNRLSYDKEWLLSGDIDKDAYFACKVTSRDAILKIYPGVKVLYEKNGYVFLIRNHD
ncbi:MAG: glycosyltransferase family 39 protein [Bacteroidales bacterium]|nr:glycosyltransferase family 39 protein [Bacteroidales bacterium]